MNTTAPIVKLENVTKNYRLGDQIVNAVNGVSFEIKNGVMLAISGPSGSGKTTLLNMIGCIDTPSSGKIYIDGEDVSGRSADQLADLRARTIGFIFQTFNLLPVLSAAENVEYPLLQRREMGQKERKRRVEFFLDMVGLGKFADHRPNQLSGGQRQRVAIARALAGQPKLILADEPTANLDKRTGMDILDLMRRINERLGATFVFSTHDPKVEAVTDRRVLVEDGAVLSYWQRQNGVWRKAPADRAAEAPPIMSGGKP